MPTTDPALRSIPAGADQADLTKLFARYSSTDVGLVAVTGRTHAEQVRAARNTEATALGLGRKPVLVLRADTSPQQIEVHPNTGAAGETWLVVSRDNEITSRDVIVKYTNPNGSNGDYSIHALFQEAFGRRQLTVANTVQVNLTSDRPLTFDTGDVAIEAGFTEVPVVQINPDQSVAGQVVTASPVAQTTSTFRIRLTRPAGYNPGARSFGWTATGWVGGAWNEGQ